MNSENLIMFSALFRALSDSVHIYHHRCHWMDIHEILYWVLLWKSVKNPTFCQVFCMWRPQYIYIYIYTHTHTHTHIHIYNRMTYFVTQQWVQKNPCCISMMVTWCATKLYVHYLSCYNTFLQLSSHDDSSLGNHLQLLKISAHMHAHISYCL